MCKPFASRQRLGSLSNMQNLDNLSQEILNISVHFLINCQWNVSDMLYLLYCKKGMNGNGTSLFYFNLYIFSIEVYLNIIQHHHITDVCGFILIYDSVNQMILLDFYLSRSNHPDPIIQINTRQSTNHIAIQRVLHDCRDLANCDRMEA